MHCKRGIKIYLAIWFVLICASIGLNVVNIKWGKTGLVHGIFFVVLIALLQTSVMEFVMQTGITLIIGGKTRFLSRANAQGLSLMLNYNLLATDKADIDECFKAMYEAYIGNLSPYIVAVLVSATKGRELKEYEVHIRNKYRRKIYADVYSEGIQFARGNASFIDPLRIKHVWSPYWHISPDEFVNEYLEDISRFYADNFMTIHRRSRVLRKCGQYQDLMLLSAGYSTAFSYCDKDLYGKKAREYGETLFHHSNDVDRLESSNFDYTLVLDADTKVMRGVAFDLLEIAAAYPQKAIIQPAIKMYVKKEDSIFMWLELARNRIFEPMTNSMSAFLGQCSYYGKALINNRIYIANIIGTPEEPIERVPIDVLSHDTFEAALLKPLYAGNVFLMETPSYNYITWYLRETRWNKGELILAMYFWKTVFGKPIRALQRFIQRKSFVPTKLRTETELDLVTSYIAHGALRQMAMKPLLLVGIIMHINIHVYFPYLPIIIVMVIIIVVPKFATCRCGYVTIVVLETIASIFQFSPEAVAGCVRIFQAFRSLLCLSISWTPQRAVEEEFKKSNVFINSLKHLWGYALVAAIAILFVVVFTTDYFLVFMLATVFILPLFTYVTSLSANNLLQGCKCLCPRRERRKMRRQMLYHRYEIEQSFTIPKIRTIKSQPDTYAITDKASASVSSISAGLAYRNMAYDSPYLPRYVFGNNLKSKI